MRSCRTGPSRGARSCLSELDLAVPPYFTKLPLACRCLPLRACPVRSSRDFIIIFFFFFFFFFFWEGGEGGGGGLCFSWPHADRDAAAEQQLSSTMLHSRPSHYNGVVRRGHAWQRHRSS